MSVLRLGSEQKRILCALGQGWALKSHRYLDGTKVYRLHSPAGAGETVAASAVAGLQQRRLLQNNHKFPAGTFLLTDKGRALAARLARQEVMALGARHYVSE